MRTAISAFAVAVSLAAIGCGDPPQLTGTVTDAWGKPLAGATVQLEGTPAHSTTDASGQFSFVIDGVTGKKKIQAGKDGFILRADSVNIAGGDTPPPSANLSLFPEPSKPGFYAVDKKDYSHLVAQPIVAQGTEIKGYTGIVDPGGSELAADNLRFVFSSTLKPSELSRLDLQLHKLNFVATEMVPGVLGDEEVAVNLWVAGDVQNFELKGLPSDNDYLIVPRGKLDVGTYAFHTEGLMTAKYKDALEKTPKEMRVAYTFTVK